jgi:hypothetical protein
MAYSGAVYEIALVSIVRALVASSTCLRPKERERLKQD